MWCLLYIYIWVSWGGGYIWRRLYALGRGVYNTHLGLVSPISGAALNPVAVYVMHGNSQLSFRKDRVPPHASCSYLVCRASMLVRISFFENFILRCNYNEIPRPIGQLIGYFFTWNRFLECILIYSSWAGLRASNNLAWQPTSKNSCLYLDLKSIIK